MPRKNLLLSLIVIFAIVLSACGPATGIVGNGNTVVNNNTTIVNSNVAPEAPAAAPVEGYGQGQNPTGPVDQSAPAANAPAPEPQITPDNSFEVKCDHQNAGKFMLLPGYSVNGGHIWVTGVEYLFVDDRVVVVTNNSDKAVEINSSDGVGLCNDVDYDRQVAMRLSEGCDANGCSEVKWVNLTSSGTDVKVIKK